MEYFGEAIVRFYWLGLKMKNKKRGGICGLSEK